MDYITSLVQSKVESLATVQIKTRTLQTEVEMWTGEKGTYLSWKETSAAGEILQIFRFIGTVSDRASLLNDLESGMLRSIWSRYYFSLAKVAA